jgi:hypothetical protein
MARGTKTSPKKIEATARAAEAVRLRVQGFTFTEIAKRAGFRSKQSAFDAVRRALEATLREPCDALRELDLIRLDAIWEVQFANAMNGDVQAANCCLKVLQQRARLLGLDMSPKEAQEQAEPARVMIVPYFETQSAWEKAAAQQQIELKRAVKE